MSDHFDQLLRNAAATIDVPPGDISAVTGRARSRRTRQRIMLGAASATAVAVAVAAVITTSHHPAPTTRVASGGEATPAATTLTWKAVNPTSALGFSNVVTASSPLYALSTAPGVASDPTTQVIYQSADGVNWSVTPSPPNLYVADLAAAGGQLYAVGTGAATAGVGSGSVPGLEAAWSSDGGHTWHTAQLPLDSATIAAGTTGTAGDALQVASGPKGTVVVASVSASLNLARYLPAGVTAPYGWAVTNSGVDLLASGTAKCPAGTTAGPGSPSAGGQVEDVTCMTPLPGNSTVRGTQPFTKAQTAANGGPAASGPVTGGPVGGAGGPRATAVPFGGRFSSETPEQAYGVSRSYTWAQLGVSDTVERVALGVPFAFYSADGSTFTAVPFPLAGGQAYGMSLLADAGGFTLAASDQNNAPLILHSPDGKTWSPVNPPAVSNGYTGAVGELQGEVAMVSQGSSGTTLSVLGSDGLWSSRPIGPDLAAGAGTIMLAGAAFGPLGVVVVTSTSTGMSNVTSQVSFSSDGTNWSTTPVSNLVSQPVAGFSTAVVTGSQAVVTLTLQPTTPNQPAQTVALVGSPS